MKTCGECVKHDECFTSSKHIACSDFISRNIVTKELEEQFPTEGRASLLRQGSKKQSSRLWRERK